MDCAMLREQSRRAIWWGECRQTGRKHPDRGSMAERWRTAAAQRAHLAGVRFSASAFWMFWPRSLYVVAAVPWAVEGRVAFLASIHQVSGAPSPDFWQSETSLDVARCLLQGQNQPSWGPLTYKEHNLIKGPQCCVLWFITECAQGCFYPREHKGRPVVGRCGSPRTADFGSRTQRRPHWTFLWLHGNLGRSYPTFFPHPSAGVRFTSQSTGSLSLLQQPPSFSHYISPNEVLACLIPCWLLPLRGPRLSLESEIPEFKFWFLLLTVCPSAGYHTSLSLIHLYSSHSRRFLWGLKELLHLKYLAWC